ncbi:hypothetical protein AUEXF2481DRAFT_29518 [Aureobasidium subglaciale EXF-2481]|uniref:Uncharacterized protein n=1 Tax=Aureobasidium subglaciale (strain EXF-2481) TaxID=1043005 RepID=A0A074YMV0_AURSE|nr:uncharacterized protein AUEXF2481DRAFT_29518 [Aureobasidium subglaciale EXF-2481]KAI5204984.1 hypothetical protein E4T38_04450 [Aureobasidium subglaciale]KAI5223872.1 hypothetical protein E4T40_04226 [Aureobasidium subglaciale]KAI5227406.1 hypothetical protein E4T41_04308 [Aureobasidium subglaciale]KAI5262684.1 hypothetical protein E4T46_04194 [Aureobasidium subglaciale]KEQ95442.1 hypothetical protein AUEXF2481DRAFT_29518 [Aureobasidium subglaciale EXF-2481]
MLPTIFTAAALMALFPSVLGGRGPVRANSGMKMYCDPGPPYDYNSWWTYDESSLCQAEGIATNCCMTVTTGGNCQPKIDAESITNLKNAVAQQSKKDDWDSCTTVGKWTVCFELLYDSLINRDVLSIYFHSIDQWVAAVEDGSLHDSSIGIMQFNYMADRTVNTMVISYNCW